MIVGRTNIPPIKAKHRMAAVLYRTNGSSDSDWDILDFVN
jgi:hypothetical protein